MPPRLNRDILLGLLHLILAHFFFFMLIMSTTTLFPAILWNDIENERMMMQGLEASLMSMCLTILSLPPMAHFIYEKTYVLMFPRFFGHHGQGRDVYRFLSHIRCYSGGLQAKHQVFPANSDWLSTFDSESRRPVWDASELPAVNWKPNFAVSSLVQEVLNIWLTCSFVRHKPSYGKLGRKHVIGTFHVYFSNQVRWPSDQEWIVMMGFWQEVLQAVGCIDGFKVEIERPTNDAVQRCFYCGLHHIHCMKTKVITDVEGKIR